jgi:hypothetical protein
VKVLAKQAKKARKKERAQKRGARTKQYAHIMIDSLRTNVTFLPAGSWHGWQQAAGA